MIPHPLGLHMGLPSAINGLAERTVNSIAAASQSRLFFTVLAPFQVNCTVIMCWQMRFCLHH